MTTEKKLKQILLMGVTLAVSLILCTAGVGINGGGGGGSINGGQGLGGTGGGTFNYNSLSNTPSLVSATNILSMFSGIANGVIPVENGNYDPTFNSIVTIPSDISDLGGVVTVSSSSFLVSANSTFSGIVQIYPGSSSGVAFSLRQTTTGGADIINFYNNSGATKLWWIDNSGNATGSGSGLTNLPYTAMSGGVSWPTNTAASPTSLAPDFAKPVQYVTTATAPTILVPINVESTKTEMQSCAVYYTNSAASHATPIAITFPASIRATGTQFITNVTRVVYEQYGQFMTNAFCFPVF